MSEESLATAQHPLATPDRTYPLDPSLAADPDAEQTRPMEVTYEYDAVDPGLFERSVRTGLDRWAPLVPPLAGAGLGEGATPLLSMPSLASWAEIDGPVYLKDESQNPTWSHKDRLNRVAVSAGIRADARAIVAASTGNHGASAAAYAARNNLPCVVLTIPGTPEAMETFVRSHGGAVLHLESYDGCTDVVDTLAERGCHAVTSTTAVHTGHPYGPEGYKTIAYETYLQFGGVPGSVFVPTAHAELLYGVWKGFRELSELGIAEETPAMVSCEPGTQAALTVARERGEPRVEIDAGETAAHSIGGSTSTHRGYVAVEQSDGRAVGVPEERIAEAQHQLSERGRWQEFSGAAAAGGLAVVDEADAPVVVLGCSSGYKDGTDWAAPRVEPEIQAVERRLAELYELDLTA